MSWKVVAYKEFLENVRNLWIVIMTSIFLVMTLATSAVLAALGEVASDGYFSSMKALVDSMRFIVGVLLPVLALMLGYGTLAGERESGSLGLLVAQPISRGEIMIGKFVGLWGLLATAVLVGLGGGALIVAASGGSDAASMRLLMTFILATLAWGAAWTAITMLVSAATDRRGTAIALASVVWFVFAILWTPIAMTFGFSNLDPAGNPPRWLHAFELLNPNAVYGGLLRTSIGAYPGFVGDALERLLPSRLEFPTFLAALVAWIVGPAAGAYALFRARDV